MMGDENDPGIIPSVIKSLFHQMCKGGEEIEYTVAVSFLEIYNEKIRDLLNLGLEFSDMDIREDTVPKATVAYVTSVKETLAYMTTGSLNRHVASTKMNIESSRSHSLFLITVKQRNRHTGINQSGRMTLVDLAGSENAKKTAATGQRLDEAKAINKSLFELGNVIKALTSGGIPPVYRNSKLTRLLQNSIGGNSKTLLIVTISPSVYNASEAMSTLSFGERAKLIQNTATKNTTVNNWENLIKQAYNTLDQQNMRIMELESVNINLKAQLNSLQKSEAPPELPPPLSIPALQPTDDQKEIERLTKFLTAADQALQRQAHHVVELTQKCESLETENTLLRNTSPIQINGNNDAGVEETKVSNTISVEEFESTVANLTTQLLDWEQKFDTGEKNFQYRLEEQHALIGQQQHLIDSLSEIIRSDSLKGDEKLDNFKQLLLLQNTQLQELHQEKIRIAQAELEFLKMEKMIELENIQQLKLRILQLLNDNEVQMAQDAVIASSILSDRMVETAEKGIMTDSPVMDETITPQDNCEFVEENKPTDTKHTEAESNSVPTDISSHEVDMDNALVDGVDREKGNEVVGSFVDANSSAEVVEPVVDANTSIDLMANHEDSFLNGEDDSIASMAVIPKGRLTTVHIPLTIERPFLRGFRKCQVFDSVVVLQYFTLRVISSDGVNNTCAKCHEIGSNSRRNRYIYDLTCKCKLHLCCFPNMGRDDAELSEYLPQTLLPCPGRCDYESTNNDIKYFKRSVQIQRHYSAGHGEDDYNRLRSSLLCCPSCASTHFNTAEDEICHVQCARCMHQFCRKCKVPWVYQHSCASNDVVKKQVVPNTGEESDDNQEDEFEYTSNNRHYDELKKGVNMYRQSHYLLPRRQQTISNQLWLNYR
jgi:hypothetical protein